MADNTGNYITYADLILTMALAGNSKVTSSKLTFSNKVVDAGGDVYEFVKADAGEQDPMIGGVIEQAGETDCIVEILSAPDRIRVEKTGAENVIVNGPVNLHQSETVPKKVGNLLIEEAMQSIDKQTGQYFNKRTGVWKIEGNNTPLMHLPVPIIEIDKLTINSTDTELKEGEDFDFVAFKARSKPTDDRENPRIKLNLGNGASSIYTDSITSRYFVKNALTEIQGSFGFLEEDGSTPSAIQRAVKLLVMNEIENPIGGSSDATSGTGPLKRLKVDLHEQEFFEASQNKDSSRSSGSGSAEVDRIIARYRTPIRISGSFISRSANETGQRGSEIL